DLSAQAQLLDEGAVALEIRLLQVSEEPAAAAHELQEASARVMVLRMGAEMLGEVVDALGQHRELHLRGAGGLRVPAVFGDQLLLRFFRERHVVLSIAVTSLPRAPCRSTRPAEMAVA